MLELLKGCFGSMARTGMVLIRVAMSLLQAFCLCGFVVNVVSFQAGNEDGGQAILVSAIIIGLLFIIGVLKRLLNVGIASLSNSDGEEE